MVVADQRMAGAAQLLVQAQCLAEIVLRGGEVAGLAQQRAEIGVGIDQVRMSDPAEHLLVDAHGLLVTLRGPRSVLLRFLHGREVRPVGRVLRMIDAHLLLVELHRLRQRVRRGRACRGFRARGP